MSYNQIPNIKPLTANNVIPPSGGSNPADLGVVDLLNIRGQLEITIIVSDDPIPVSASFIISGGWGEYPCDPTQDFYFIGNSNVNCTVTSPVKNSFIINTTLAGLGGTDRQYTLVFRPLQSFGPQIQQTSINTIGPNTLTVRMTKNRNVAS